MYQFKVGEKTKFKTFSDYTSRGFHPWARLIVDESDAFFTKGHLHENPEITFEAETKDLDTPMGYQDVYKIIVNDPEKKETILGWLKDRGGISVWCSLDLSTAGRYSYTPGDRSAEKPHWSMGFVEVVTDPRRIEVHLEITRLNKPEKENKHKWKYDRRMREWYQVLKLFPV
jgi:hypothetical protein